MKNEQDKIQKHNQSVSKLIKFEEQGSFYNQTPIIILSNPTFLESKYQSAHNLPSIKKSTLQAGNNHLLSSNKLEAFADRKYNEGLMIDRDSQSPLRDALNRTLDTTSKN
jgi:hypothetical protein